ncbi:MAG: hypothetical protein KatS3mg015_2456 [Fimbriimonadales bacterium]|nr:MAG: hypothetical protein KatS3mg015_2456 [Fimbriimonadales bacterium]
MANFSFDVALGREVELYNRVLTNDPANSALVLVVLTASGLEPDATLRTYSNLSALLAASNNEVTNAGYTRKVLTDADLVPYTVDTVNHKITLPFPSQTYTAIAAGDSWRKLLVCYDADTTAGTDADIVPVCAQDLLVDNLPLVPNGGNIVLTWPLGLLTAS